MSFTCDYPFTTTDTKTTQNQNNVPRFFGFWLSVTKLMLLSLKSPLPEF
jgi:hypothetical protein